MTTYSNRRARRAGEHLSWLPSPSDAKTTSDGDGSQDNLVRVGDGGRWVYTLLVMEGYSHKIPAGMSTEYQDTVAMLQLLAAALAEYGRAAGMVSDNGSVFTSEVYEGLGARVGLV